MTSSPLEGAQEIQGMLVDYAKQETVEPLKRLGKYLGLGVAGSILMFLGALFVGLGALRLSQTFFEGSSFLSTLPYLISLVVLGLAMLFIYMALTRAKRKVAPVTVPGNPT